MIWDFDGTLAYREGNWRGAMIQVLDEHHAGHEVEMGTLSPLIHNGFPWDAEDLAHPEVTDADVWWEPMEAMLARAFAGVGHDDERAAWLAARTRAQFIDHTVSWHLFDDTLPVLDQLTADGWKHVVLSNHVPELPAIMRGLGVYDRFDAVLTSASMGYEKPHPQAFALAREAAGDPRVVWMVGDNPNADAAGARAVGIPAIHVRTAGGVPFTDVPGLLAAGVSE